MEFYDPTGEVVACGEYGNSGYKSCFSFDGVTWTSLPPLHENHFSYTYYTRSYFMEGLGLWVGGSDGDGGIVSELFNSEGQWITLPVDSPYENIRYPYPCSVPLNNTHIFFSGGFSFEQGAYLADTWVLNLENLEWTSSTPMFTPREQHGCVLTDAGEVLVAGGQGESSVEIFNPVTLEWRERGNLPSEIYYAKYPGLLLWNDTVIFVETDTANIWAMREEDQGWQLMNATMGASFRGDYDTAVVLPESWSQRCP